MILLFVWLQNGNHISENPKSEMETTYPKTLNLKILTVVFPCLWQLKTSKITSFMHFDHMSQVEKKASHHPSTHKTDKNGLNNVIVHLNITSWVNHYN
jgi:hypothetical protein